MQTIGLRPTPIKHFAGSDHGRQTEFARTNRHMRVHSAPCRYKTCDGIRKKPIESRVGIGDANNCSREDFPIFSVRYRSGSLLLGNKVWRNFRDLKDQASSRANNERRQGNGLCFLIALLTLANTGKKGLRRGSELKYKVP